MLCVLWDTGFYFGFCFSEQDTFALRAFLKNILLGKAEKKFDVFKKWSEAVKL